MAWGKNKEEKEGREEHEWEREWLTAHYKEHEKELFQIDVDWAQCLSLSQDSKMHPEYHYHQMHGAMNKNFYVIHDLSRASKGELQAFEVNLLKLDKYQRWKAMNLTPQERVLAERRRAIIVADIMRIMKQKVIQHEDPQT